jgi:2-polyprenyl-3-methyl-5-hydroxy-6-metoxy-1,4-benzoquinol methylase
MLRILVAIASYGTGNDLYLHRLIAEYRSMSFHVDIVVLSNIEKNISPTIECLIGLPDRNPLSLPFAHKKLFVERANAYDIFVYSEDDILVTENNIRAFLSVTDLLNENEIAGFLRIEKSMEGKKSFPDMHDLFHWDHQSIQIRGDQIFARCTNEHSACYILTNSQLRAAINSGGFSVDVHESKYDLPCTAATDPYTQCGLTKLIPVSSIDRFCVHHMSNRYVGIMGIDEAEMRDQIATILRIAREPQPHCSLFKTETELPRALYSKNYYEPVDLAAISLIPQTANCVLSIGCGWGATERALVQRGLRVVAIPLDPIISTNAAAGGVELASCGDLREIVNLLRKEKIDCVLCLNILHVCENPTALLSTLNDCLAPRVKIVVRSPNMLSISGLRNLLRDSAFVRLLRHKRLADGVHLSSLGTMRDWFIRAQMRIDETAVHFTDWEEAEMGRRRRGIGGLLPEVLSRFFAPFLLFSAIRSPRVE